MSAKKLDNGESRSVYNSGEDNQLGADFAVVIMDALLTMPAASILQSGITTFSGFRERSLRRKLAGFLNELNRYSKEEREDFQRQKMKDPACFQLASEITLDILDNADTELKARMVGKAFSRYLSGELSQISFEADVSVMRSLNLYLIRQLRQVYISDTVAAYDNQAGSLFASLGLMSPISPQQHRGEVATHHVANKFGKSFYDMYVKELDIPTPQG